MSATIIALASIIIGFSAIPLRAENPIDGKIIIRPELNPEELQKGIGDSLAPGVGLAISGGGARGLAAIGILKVFEREKIKVKFIAGVSMGSIIGGLYACGYSADEIEQIALKIDWADIFSPGPLRSALLTTQKGQAEKSLFKLRFQGWKPVIPRAVTSAQKLSQLLENLSARGGIRSSVSFDYLEPPIRIVCTDLLSGEKVVISSGNIGEAMRASIGVPVAFTPVEMGGKLLVDGGLVDPIPVDIVKDAIGGPVVAIDVASDLLPQSGITNIIDIADQTTTIMSMDKKREAIKLADYCITPELHGRTATDFSHPESLIVAGELAAEKALPAIRLLLSSSEAAAVDYPRHRITKTEISGLSRMPKTLFMKTFSEDSIMTAKTIEANLRAAYNSGYITSAWAEISPDDSSATLIYHLTDNPRVGSLRFQGAKIFSGQELYKLVETKPGTILNFKTLENDRKVLEEHYIVSGYSLARVSAVFDTLTSSLVFKIDEGLINQIRIEGTARTRNWVITRHIPFKNGEVFRQKKAERAIDEIFGTGLFETAKLIAVPDSAGITLVVKVREKPYNFIRGGARFDLEYKARAFLDLVADNVFGGGQEMYLSSRFGEKLRSLTLNLHSDRILRTLFTNSISVDYSEFKQNHYVGHKYSGYYRRTSYGCELTFGRQFPQLGTFSLVGNLSQNKWNEPDKAAQRSFARIGVGVRSIVDTRDALSFPEKGKYHIFDLELASNIHNEKRAYTRFETSIESYYKLSKRLNFHAKLALGTSSDFMPYFDEFSFRSPHHFLGLYDDEYLGDKMLLGVLGLRQKVGDRFYIMTRYNAGNIWNKLETVRLSRLMHGGGLGFGIKTPMGPAEFWYGRTDKGLDAFYLNIGYDW